MSVFLGEKTFKTIAEIGGGKIMGSINEKTLEHNKKRGRILKGPYYA